MTSDSLPPRVNDIVVSHPEVEFALVLARTIDAVSGDPEQLRSAVYELARHKLQQLSAADPAEKARLMHALEVAIVGVESHVTTSGQQSLPRPSSLLVHRPALASRLPESLIEASQTTFEPAHYLPEREGRGSVVAPASMAPVHARRLLSSMPARLAVVLLSIAAIVIGIASIRRHGADLATLQPRLFGAREPAGTATPAPASATPAPEPPVPTATAAVATAAPARDPRLPTAYGVYAESAGRLVELQQLPGRVPDSRVAISAAITKPSEAALPDGRLKFIVFQRDAAPDAFDKVEVRTVARIRQATSFDPSGKPVVSNEGETWVIRNISIPCRASPLRDDPQMYEITPRDPDLHFAAGRYALVLKARAFDFTIGGPVTDKRQCLERLVAVNGTFYSECAKP
jgi:hypothetical protein